MGDLVPFRPRPRPWWGSPGAVAGAYLTAAAVGLALAMLLAG